MKRWPPRGRVRQGYSLLVSAALPVCLLCAGYAFISSGASGSGPLPQIRHVQRAPTNSAQCVSAMKPSRLATAIPSWLLLGCALTFLRCGSRSKSWPRGRRVGAAAFRGAQKQLHVALGCVQPAGEFLQCPGEPTSQPPALRAAVPLLAGQQVPTTTPQCAASDFGDLAPPSAPWMIPPAMTQLHANVVCEAASSTSTPQSKPKPARFVGRTRYSSRSQRPRSSNTATRATRKQVGSRLQGKAAKIEVPQLSYDVSRLRAALQVGLRAQHQRRSERPRESSAPSSSNGLKDQSSELYTAFLTIFVRYARPVSALH